MHKLQHPATYGRGLDQPLHPLGAFSRWSGTPSALQDLAQSTHTQACKHTGAGPLPPIQVVSTEQGSSLRDPNTAGARCRPPLLRCTRQPVPFEHFGQAGQVHCTFGLDLELIRGVLLARGAAAGAVGLPGVSSVQHEGLSVWLLHRAGCSLVANGAGHPHLNSWHARPRSGLLLLSGTDTTHADDVRCPLGQQCGMDQSLKQTCRVGGSSSDASGPHRESR